ncbi:MAG: hypothetical protein GY868_00945 [Deltaproteobacteria bacterium]|nr:hypothetical protein [Deltaproteobacteria bacterium]
MIHAKKTWPQEAPSTEAKNQQFNVFVFKSHFDRAEPERFVAETRDRLFERSEFLARRSKPLRLGYPKDRSNGCLFFCIL